MQISNTVTHPICARLPGGGLRRTAASLSLALLALLLGCGGAPKEAAEPQPGSAGDPATEEGQAAQTEAPAPQGAACRVKENDEETVVVFSEENDWFFTANKESQIDCKNERGIADINMAGIRVNLTVQQLESELTLDQAVQELLKGYAEGVSESVSFDKPLTFEEKSIGEHGRRAFISDGRFEVNGQTLHLLTSVTAAMNANNEGIFHIVFWNLEEGDFKENEKLALETLETVSAYWFRLSDLDEEGNFVKQW